MKKLFISLLMLIIIQACEHRTNGNQQDDKSVNPENVTKIQFEVTGFMSPFNHKMVINPNLITYHFEYYNGSNKVGRDSSFVTDSSDWNDIINSFQINSLINLNESYNTTTGKGESEKHTIEITTNIRNKKVQYTFEDSIPVSSIKNLDTKLSAIMEKLLKKMR
ncbi:MAG: hypothetical protein HW421_2113 [Ignavibacteria bacterium]|nr:hypothetical protein [Ignavibacteria bacterium]